VAGRAVLLKQVAHYDAIRHRLREDGGTAATTTLEAAIGDQTELLDVIKIVDRLCTLLSFCRGTMITWTSYEIRDASDAVLTTHLISAKTKQYSPMPVIPENYGRQTAVFVHEVFDRYVEIEDIFQMPAVIRARLDVNDSNVFLDTRAMVGAALIEFLMTRCAKQFDYRPPDEGKSPSLTNLFAANTDLRLGLSSEDIRAIYRTRNKLMHAMSFATDDQGAEYLLIGHALNVTIMRLLRYTGAFVDCRTWQRETLEERTGGDAPSELESSRPLAT
jgi:hypothetical protein